MRRRLATTVRLTFQLGGEFREITIRPGQADVRISLRTADPVEAKARQAALIAHFGRVWQALRDQSPISLSHEQAVALSKEIYLAEFRNAASQLFLEFEEWEALLLDLEDLEVQLDEDQLEERFGAFADRLLNSKGILRVDTSSRQMLLRELLRSLKQAFGQRQRQSEGDYSPDVKAARFPEWQHTGEASPATAPAVSLKGLMDAWWVEAKATGRKPSTYESYKRTLAAFSDFVGHDDAGRMTREDVVRFKDFRLTSTNPRNGRAISPRTVKDTDLAGLKSVFGWAVANGKLTSNPAQGVSIQRIRSRTPRRGFSESEARAILQAASRATAGREHPETLAAKRWVPWLLAYTGARVGEIGQLRKKDIKQVGEFWTLTITPEAGPVKTDKARTVVLHPHLLELGFPQFVGRAHDSQLFLRVPPGGDVRGPLKALANRLREFVREVVTDTSVDPNHGWRHRFKTMCREARVDPEVRDYIQGHSPRTVSERYGEMPLEAQVVEIKKLPRYEIR